MCGRRGPPAILGIHWVVLSYSPFLLVGEFLGFCCACIYPQSLRWFLACRRFRCLEESALGQFNCAKAQSIYRRPFGDRPRPLYRLRITTQQTPRVVGEPGGGSSSRRNAASNSRAAVARKRGRVAIPATPARPQQADPAFTAGGGSAISMVLSAGTAAS